ncbi:MAG: hypothetical protein QM765_38890 [Myxococcales bacterium]
MIENLGAFPLDKQALLLSTFRGSRESSGGGYRVIAVGKWRPQQLLSQWKKFDAGSSPSFDSNAIQWVGGYSAGVLEDLVERSLSDTDGMVEPLAALILDQTGGDRRLVDYLLRALNESDRRRPEELERLLFSMAEEEGPVTDFLLAGYDTLSDRAKAILNLLVHNTAAYLPSKDHDCEDLRSLGFVERESRGPSISRSLWRISSPIMVRSLLRTIDSSHCAQLVAGESLPPRHAIATSAMSQVTEIENLLRNFALQRLAERSDPIHPLKLVARTGGSDPYADAHRRLKEDADEHQLLVRTPLFGYADVSALGLLYKQSDLYSSFFEEVFGDKAQFAVRFDEFSAIRHDVAHNRLYSVRALRRLKSLRDFFEQHIAQYGERVLLALEWRGRLQCGSAPRVFPPSKGEASRVSVVVRNASSSRLVEASLRACFRSSSRTYWGAQVSPGALTLMPDSSEEVVFEVGAKCDAPVELVELVVAVVR